MITKELETLNKILEEPYVNFDKFLGLDDESIGNYIKKCSEEFEKKLENNSFENNPISQLKQL